MVSTTTTNLPAGYETMARGLEQDLLALEALAARSGRRSDRARVAAVRAELNRVRRGEL